MTTTLYAYITIDSVKRGKHHAICVAEKPMLSHSEYAIYKLDVDIPDTIEYTPSLNDYNRIPHVRIDWSDYNSIAADGDYAWCSLAWHITTHRIYIASDLEPFAVLKGCHVKHWEEI